MRSGYERIGRTVSIERAKRSCLDKRPYASRNEARDAAARNAKRYGNELRWYRCTICGKFHLTTMRKDKRGSGNGLRRKGKR